MCCVMCCVLCCASGQGGCDLNGNKGQIKDQALAGVNAAMLANIALGIPLRVLRRNEDPSSSTGSSLIYDGLYNVVSSAAEGSGGGVEDEGMHHAVEM